MERKLFAELKKVGKTLDDLSGFDPDMQAWVEQMFGKPPEDRMGMSDLTIVPGDRADYLPSAVPGDMKRITEAVKIARNNSSLVLATLHAHEARLRPELSAPLPRIAREEKAVEILTGLAALSKPFGTTITIEDGVGRVVLG